MRFLPGPSRLGRQLYADIQVWVSSRWLWIGGTLAVGLLAIYLWVQSGAVLSEFGDHTHADLLVPAESYGVFARSLSLIVEGVTLFGVLLGGTSIATETGSGRIRALMAQPLRRVEFFLSRFIRVQGATLLFYGLLVGFCYLFLEWRLGFGTVVAPEHPTNAALEYASRHGMMTRFVRILLLSILPVCVTVSVGLFISTLSRNGTQSLMVTIFVYLFVRGLATYPAGWVEDYIFLGGLHHFLEQGQDLANRSSPTYNAIMEHGPTDLFFLISLAAGTVLTLGAWMVFERKDLR